MFNQLMNMTKNSELAEDELSMLKAKLAESERLREAANSRNVVLERHLALLTENNQVSGDLLAVVNKMDSQFSTIGTFLDDIIKPMTLRIGEIEANGDLIARIECLTRYRKTCNDGEYLSARNMLLGGYYKHDRYQQALFSTVDGLSHDDVASAIASRLSYLSADKGVESVVYAFCKAAFLQEPATMANVAELVDVTRDMYKHVTENDIDVSPLFTYEHNSPAAGIDKDHIYGKHYLDRQTMALLHSLSHISDDIKGDGLALYHIGKATRFAECSIIYVNGTPFKPFRVMNEYAIFPTLPCEYYGRVEAIVQLLGGMSPITLVRVRSDISSGLVTGSISSVVSSLLSNYLLYSCRIDFGVNGIHINATGNSDHVNRTTLNCCGRAFGAAPPMDVWMKSRPNYRAHFSDKYKRRERHLIKRYRVNVESTKPCNDATIPE
ncbi:VP6 [Banna-like virus strain Balaton/2010/HUN]|nr:VP6 [Banna-like virus strain Balaton/2010/HUN]